MKIKINYIIDLLFISVFAFFSVENDSEFEFHSILFYIALILYYLFLLIKIKKNKSLIIFWVFSVTYPIYFGAYFILDIPYHYLIETQSMSNTIWVLSLHGLFLSVMFFGNLPKTINKADVILKFNNGFVFWILIIFVWLMYPFSLYAYPPLLGESYTGDVNSSIWIEYCIPFFIVIYLYSNTNRKRKLLHWTIIFYLSYPFLYSRRLQMIMYLLLVFFLFYESRLKYRHVLFIAIAGFLGLRVFASIRMGVDLTFLESVFSIDEKGIMGNNQGGVLVSSTVYLQLIQDGIFNMETRLKSFLGFLFSPIIPSSFNFEETYINLFAIKYRPLPGNGGFPGVYTYIWGGYFLLVLFAYFIRKKFLWGFGRVDYAITAFLFCTFPRWHSYNLIILIKLLFWMIILISICDTLTKKWRTRCDPISPVL